MLDKIRPCLYGYSNLHTSRNFNYNLTRIGFLIATKNLSRCPPKCPSKCPPKFKNEPNQARSTIKN